MVLLMATTSFCQQHLPSQTITREAYLKKSRSQKIAGFVFLGIGITTFALLSPGNTSFDNLATFAIAGTVSTLASVPLFIASGKNKRRARKASAYLKLERGRSFVHNGLPLRTYPAASLKIPF